MKVRFPRRPALTHDGNIPRVSFCVEGGRRRRSACGTRAAAPRVGLASAGAQTGRPEAAEGGPDPALQNRVWTRGQERILDVRG